MQRTAVINVVGLTEALIGPDTPRIRAFRQHGACAKIVPAFPALTCTAQSTYLTGASPAHHGIVGNGWYERKLDEVQFWKQSNHLVQGRKLWEELRERVAKFSTFTPGHTRFEGRSKRSWASFRFQLSGGRPPAYRRRKVPRMPPRAG